MTVAAANFNYETATSHTITVKATSSDGSVAYTDFTITVTDVNEAGDLTLNAISTVRGQAGYSQRRGCGGVLNE